MNWELYEVWSIDYDGIETLIDTTKSLKEAKQLAHANCIDGGECVIYREDEDGELIEIERVQAPIA